MNKNELMLPSDRVILKVDLVVSPWAVLPDLPEKKKLLCVCGLLPKTLTLFMTKNFDFTLYPIYDLTKNLMPYL